MALDQQVNKFLVIDWTNSPVSIFYAGAAPGSFFGVFQINLQLPATASGSGSFTLQSTSTLGQTIYSNSVQVYMK